MRVWILGGQGLLGKSVLRMYEARGCTVLATGKKDGDICNPSILETHAKRFEPTHIVNCAAFTDVDAAENHEALAYEINAKGARNVANIAKEQGAKCMYISTDYVFDGAQPGSYDEKAPCFPCNVYGKSKREGEQAVMEAYPSSCILRISWLFGHQGRTFFSSLPRLMKERKEIRVAKEQQGRLTYVEDAAEAIFSLQEQSGIWHFANRGTVTRFEVATYVREKLLKDGCSLACQEIIPVEASLFMQQAARPTFSILNTEKYTKEIGHSPRDWQKAIDDFLKE